MGPSRGLPNHAKVAGVLNQTTSYGPRTHASNAARGTGSKRRIATSNGRPALPTHDARHVRGRAASG